MKSLNKDELFLIAKLLDLQTFLNFKKTNKRINELCKKDHIWYYILERDYDKPEVRFTDELLLKYPKIRALYASNNPKITDESVKELKYLHTLKATGWNSKITDKSVKELKSLQILYASGNRKITDKSVKELKKLHTLFAGWNPNITDKSVKELKYLHTLDASGRNSKITDKSVKELQFLHKLCSFNIKWNPN